MSCSPKSIALDLDDVKPFAMSEKQAAGWKRLIVGRSPRRTLVRLGFIAVAAVLVGLAARPVWIQGESMEPTYHDGTLRVANLAVYRWRDPRPGEVVAIRLAGLHVMYLKRVLAVPGDTVAFRDGTLWINGEPRAEPYVVRTGAWNVAATQGKADEYFVAGDNRSMPAEYHLFGWVSRSRIAGGMFW